MQTALNSALALCTQVFETLKAQEATKQQELKAKEAEFKAAAEKAAIVRGAQRAAHALYLLHWLPSMLSCGTACSAPYNLLLERRQAAQPPAPRGAHAALPAEHFLCPACPPVWAGA